MSGECDNCGEHAVDCQCFNKIRKCYDDIGCTFISSEAVDPGPEMLESIPIYITPEEYDSYIKERYVEEESDSIYILLSLEERKFLNRMCGRTYRLESLGIDTGTTKDLDKLMKLKMKFKIDEYFNEK